MRNLKIKYKIAITSILLIAVFGISITAVYSYIHYNSGIENYKITGESIIKNTELHAADHIYMNDIVGLQRMVTDIKESNRDVVYAFILNPENDIVVHTFNQNFPSDLLKINIKPIQNIELLDIRDDTVYDFSYPIVEGKLGIIRIGISTERLYDDLKNVLLDAIILFFVFIIFGIVVSLYISRLITNSLDQLVLSADKMSTGDFNQAIEVKSKDEIGLLSLSFNSMSYGLKNLTDKLEEKIGLLNQKNNEYEVLNEELLIAKEKAEESDRLKSAFLANMSHEIRTPMNGILGFADLLKEPELTGEQQQKYIGIIEKSGTRMLNIINDIIDISKIEAGLMKVDTKESNINEQMEYIFTFFKPEVEAKGMKLSFKNTLPAKEAIIKTDSEKLFAILTNLVKNAIKYTNEGSIEFGYKLVTMEHTTSLQFFVKDTGVGILKDSQETIFERFIQTDIVVEMACQGAGLGLAITKAYTEMLGGKIWVESEEGVGSCFYFTLPYNKIEPNEQNSSKGALMSDDRVNEIIPEISGLKILIAEDDKNSEMYLRVIIKSLCKEILIAETGFEAVEAYRKNPDIDLILMDIQMPEMSGYEAIRKIREFNKDVIIIAQTAFGLSGDREKALEAGCNDYIAKPIKKEVLMGLIEKYFNKYVRNKLTFK